MGEPVAASTGISGLAPGPYRRFLPGGRCRVGPPYRAIYYCILERAGLHLSYRFPATVLPRYLPCTGESDSCTTRYLISPVRSSTIYGVHGCPWHSGGRFLLIVGLIIRRPVQEIYGYRLLAL